MPTGYTLGDAPESDILRIALREISRLGLLLQCCVHGSSAGKGRDEWESPKKQSRDYSSKQCMVLIDIVSEVPLHSQRELRNVKSELS